MSNVLRHSTFTIIIKMINMMKCIYEPAGSSENNKSNKKEYCVSGSYFFWTFYDCSGSSYVFKYHYVTIWFPALIILSGLQMLLAGSNLAKRIRDGIRIKFKAYLLPPSNHPPIRLGFVEGQQYFRNIHSIFSIQIFQIFHLWPPACGLFKDNNISEISTFFIKYFTIS